MGCCRSKHELVNFIPKQEYHKERRNCLRENKLFEDDEFPAGTRILSEEYARNSRVEWLRPKDICERSGEGKLPMMEVLPRDRFDINQGALRNCWFVAALSNLAESDVLFNNVVPKNQDFSAGIFRFRFFRLGRWEEVVIDDRLPTCDGKLIYLKSVDSNEFWSALLEKAYAKLHGGYGVLEGGKSAEAAVDFTGGISEKLDLTEMTKDEKKKQFSVLKIASQNKAFMSCSVSGKVYNTNTKTENLKRQTGLTAGHAYTITGFQEIQERNKNEKTFLIRLRNPWGSEEWKGAWSDEDDDHWNDTEQACCFPKTFKNIVGMEKKSDGEFYMNYTEDFLNYFGELEIVWLTPNYMERENQRKLFKVFEFHNKWEGKTAGGIVNQSNNVMASYLVNNPKFMFSLNNSDADRLSAVIISLSQKAARKQKTQIGFRIYKCEEGQDINEEFLRQNTAHAESGTYIDSREIIKRCRFTRGTYCIIPSTFRPGVNGKFLLRVFVERDWGVLPTQENEGVEVSVRDLFGCCGRKIFYRRRGCCGGGCLPSCFAQGCCGGECWDGCYRGGWMPNCRGCCGDKKEKYRKTEEGKDDEESDRTRGFKGLSFTTWGYRFDAEKEIVTL